MHRGRAAGRRPVYVVGLPRSGTTWVASILRTARGVVYCHEPFNFQTYPNAFSHVLKYLRADDLDHEFGHRCRAAFEGRMLPLADAARWMLLPWRTRILVKDVHTFFALDWLDRHIGPDLVIVIRDPCGVAASWRRLGYAIDGFLERIHSQPRLIRDHLECFKPLHSRAREYFQKAGLLWGAAYRVLLRQRETHPGWRIVQHEALCRDPEAEFRRLFGHLTLQWTRATDEVLRTSTTRNSQEPYLPVRISSREPGKWSAELSAQEMQAVRRFADPFEIPYYRGDSVNDA